MASDLGREVHRLQQRVHRQRVAHVTLKLKYRQLFIEHDRRRKLIDEARHAVASAKAQAERMTASMRIGALHGIRLDPSEDRLEGMALIVQQLRARNMEQYRALTDLNAAAHYVTRWFSDDEDQETVTVARYQAEALIVAVQGATGVIGGDKSNLTKELERQTAKAKDYAAEVKTVTARLLMALICRVGPVRKRDLKAAAEAIAKV